MGLYVLPLDLHAERGGCEVNDRDQSCEGGETCVGSGNLMGDFGDVEDRGSEREHNGHPHEGRDGGHEKNPSGEHHRRDDDEPYDSVRLGVDAENVLGRLGRVFFRGGRRAFSVCLSGPGVDFVCFSFGFGVCLFVRDLGRSFMVA
jgi:hypothetical protein